MTAASPARSGRGRRSTRPSGEDREAAILRTAERLLETSKFADISVDDLAKGAGLSRPTFYFYFPSKEAVLLTLLDRVMVEANSRLGSFASVLTADRDASLRAGINAFFATFAAHPAVCAAAAEVKANSPEVRELWADFMQRSIDHTTGVIEAERAKRRRPGDPARARVVDRAESDERGGDDVVDRRLLRRRCPPTASWTPSSSSGAPRSTANPA